MEILGRIKDILKKVKYMKNDEKHIGSKQIL